MKVLFTMFKAESNSYEIGHSVGHIAFSVKPYFYGALEFVGLNNLNKGNFQLRLR
ncbi:hypothetical protein [Paenimyroides aestuarii]|uniref:Uncharacterized protein n=1 Tax=Paenimyroides aestuarii TaxID=2968490 RepID=A0ABY5NW06_9FLAO|nr:hypothetical protein [Paenimyroides aestuarii]UUV22607.1 hypothetical protein NPX36_06070 [Paenimyroides aestuarii]